MSVIDVRDKSDIVFDMIRFAENNNKNCDYIPCILYIDGDGEINITDCEYDRQSFECLTVSDVKNLIKAFEKAIELGWFKKD